MGQINQIYLWTYHYLLYIDQLIGIFFISKLEPIWIQLKHQGEAFKAQSFSNFIKSLKLQNSY